MQINIRKSILTIALLIFLLIAYLTRDKTSFIEKIENKEINSIIKGKYIMTDNHNIPIIKFGQNDSLIINKDWFSKISIGDSIIKEIGSKTLKIKNKNKYEELTYQGSY